MGYNIIIKPARSVKPDDDYPLENFGRKRLRYFGAVNCFVCIKEELDTGEYGAGAYPLVADVAAAYFDGITKLYRSFSPEELKSDTEISLLYANAQMAQREIEAKATALKDV